jgi:ribonuclease HII
MLEMDRMYAGYGFASHKGYPTPEHCRALKELGALPIHRRSFARVREVLGLDPIQNELFAESNVVDSGEVETFAAAGN